VQFFYQGINKINTRIGLVKFGRNAFQTEESLFWVEQKKKEKRKKGKKKKKKTNRKT
jgi:hypothetical protein